MTAPAIYTSDSPLSESEFYGFQSDVERGYVLDQNSERAYYRAYKKIFRDGLHHEGLKVELYVTWGVKTAEQSFIFPNPFEKKADWFFENCQSP
jgi:hypothetical protein